METRTGEAIVAVLLADATFAMPPHPNWFRGRDAVITFITGVGRPPLRFVATSANGQPAVGWYIRYTPGGSFLPASLEVLTLDGDRVKDIIAFAMPELFGRFGLPGEMSARTP